MIKKDSLFNAVISLELIGKISAIGFEVEYDPEYLEFQEAKLNQVFTSEIVNQNDEQPTIISIGLNNVSGYLEDATRPELLKLNFKALKTGDTELRVIPGEILLDDDEVTELFEWIVENTQFTVDDNFKLVMKITIEEIAGVE